MIDRVAVAVSAGLLESVTSTARPEMPEALGVPVIAPVEVLRLSPAGSDSVITAQV